MNTSPPKSGRSPLIIAFFTIFLDLLGFGIIIPIAPFYAESFGATPALITLLSATYSLMQFLFAPFWGRLSDRIGRRPVMLISIAISAAGHFVFAMAGSLWVLFLSRSIAGFGCANLGTAQALIADSTSPEDRAKGMGLVGAAFGLGFILGPAIGALLGQYHPTTPLFAAGILALINLFVVWKFLPETRPPKNESMRPKRTLKTQWAAIRQSDNTVTILWITLVSTIAFAQMEQSIALYIEHNWVVDTGLSVNDRISEASKLTGYYLVAVGITAAIIQGGLIGRLSRRFGEIRLCIVGLCIMTIGLALIPIVGSTGSYVSLLMVAPFLATGTGLLMPSKNSLLSRSVELDQQGSVMGLNQSSAALGRVIGPSCAGIIYEFDMTYPFYGGALLMIIGVLLSLRLKRSAPV